MRGAQARSIFRPIIKNRAAGAETEATNDEVPAGSRLVGFKMVNCLFPLSKTTGKELAPAKELPGWDAVAAEAKLDIREVPFDELNGNVQGYSVGLELAINPVAANSDKARFHEVGHIVSGYTLPSQIGEYRLHRGIKEFEAESTAYLCMHELGQLDEESASHSRAYIQEWLKGERPSDESIRGIFRATDAILLAGRLSVSDVAE